MTIDSHAQTKSAFTGGLIHLVKAPILRKYRDAPRTPPHFE